MPDRTESGITPRFICILALACLLPVIAWTGSFDRLSESCLDRALTGAGIIYATARGINALVSVLQGTELDLVALTFSIGEILDPVNDLIERFSGILLIALASLALQKILLGVVSHQAFNLLLTAAAAATVATGLWRRDGLYRVCLRVFVAIAFLRFALAVVVVANNAVDSAFLDRHDDARLEAMREFEGELRQISTAAGVDGPSEEAIAAGREGIASLRRARAAETRSLEQQETALAAAGTRLDALRADIPWWQRLTADPPEIVRAKREVAQAQRDIDATEHTLDWLDTELARQQETLACLEKRASGEACGLVEGLTSSLSPTQIRARINALEGRITDFADNAVQLLMSALLKSVLIPLLFIYALFRLARRLRA